MTDKKTEALKLALKRAFNLGQTYWQQADSEYTSQWKKADVTLASFNQLVEDTIREALAEQPAQQELTEKELSDGLAMALHDAVLIRLGGNDEATMQACARIDKLVDKYRAEKPEIKTAQQDSTCNKKLHEQGKAYPRTCKKCGLGPCIADRVQPAPATELREQQEPVVWMYVNKSTHETKFQKHMRDFVDHSLWSEVPLYGEPLANHELQCVCGAVWLGDEMVHLPDKRPPASKPWVALTVDELESGSQIEKAKSGAALDLSTAFWAGARWAEAKLREKNA